ncbi:MAG TPA: hypothetical protein VM243_13650 [Phycisphaerae bacterium]|nr:hypothetical protein [Phycisphaerae bacterium]
MSDDTEASDLLCPQCGYDLRGIPEQRCPECGFGFDHAALRALTSQDNWERDSAYRRTILWAALSVALLVSPVLRGTSLSGLPRLVMIVAPLLAVVGLKKVYTDPRAPTLVPDLWSGWLGVVLVICCGFVLALVDRLASALVAGALVLAWLTWAALVARSGVASRAAQGEERRLLTLHGTLAMIALAAATALVILCWWLT